MRVNTTPTFRATTALAQNLRVKLSTGKLVVADEDDDELGTLAGPALAADGLVGLIPRGESGVRKCVAAGAITQYATIYAAAGGKIDDSGTLERGIALDAASGDGSIIDVLWQGPTEVPAT